MNTSDALTITALGMAVVFSGLLLTATLITAFEFLPRLIDRSRRTPVEAARIAPPAASDVPSDVVAVITAVLEIERRLYHADPGGRLTIARRREGPQP